MSDSQDAKNQKRAKAAALARAVPGADGLYDFTTFKDAFDYGDNFQIPEGGRFKDPGSVDAWVNGGFGFGGIYDDSPISAVEYMRQTGMTPRQFAEQFESVPFRWHDDGTVSYDSTAAKNKYEYRPASYDKTARNAMMSFAALMGGAALAGGFGGAAAGAGEVAAGGAMDMGVGLGGNLGAWGGITPLADGAATLGAGAAGGAMDMGIGLGGDLGSWGGITPLAESLGTTPTIAKQVVEVAKQVASKPGATSQMLSQAIKSVTGLDVDPSVIGTIGKIGVAALAASGGSGSGSGSIGNTAAAQGQAANDAMALAREQWAWNKSRADEIWPQTKALVDQQLKTAQINSDRAQSEWDTYQSLYLPAEKQYVDKMTNWDTPDRRTQRIQEAVADVNRGYDAARGTMERGLERSGVRPGGAGFTQAEGDLARAQAADTAGAANTTRRQVENEGIAGLERVTNIGRGRPSTSFAADQLALQAGNSANANTNANTAATNTGLNSANSWFNSGISALNSAGNMQNAAVKNEQTSSTGFGKLLSDIIGFADGGLVRRGKRAGYANGGIVRRAARKLMRMGFADGGLIRGPGTTTSDSIPAVIDGEEPTALSTGEAVLNAEAVNIVGPDFVERINQAGLQRRGTRQPETIEGLSRRVA